MIQRPFIQQTSVISSLQVTKKVINVQYLTIELMTSILVNSIMRKLTKD
jgi:hypothetical protein